jgi:hypothetical protein
MRRIFKFLRLRPADQLLFAGSLFLVAAIRAGLTFIPFQTLHRLLDRMADEPVPPGKTDDAYEASVTQAVATVSRLVPQATCLTQALAVQVLLRRKGHQTFLRFGVAPPRNGRLEAHAWIESHGRVIIGGAGLAAFTPLAATQKAPEPLR